MKNFGLPGFQILNDNEILSSVEEEQQTVIDGEDIGDEEDEENSKRPNHAEAFSALDTAMSWYEQQEKSCPTQILLLKRIRDLSAKKRQQKSIQKKIDDYFSIQL